MAAVVCCAMRQLTVPNPPRSQRMNPGYLERARAIQTEQQYPISGWITELNRVHARNPEIWALSVVAEILLAVREVQGRQL
jgi:hypothetical protein